MSIATNVEARIQSVTVTDDEISAQLVDGRTITVPLAWSWRLSDATPARRARFEILGSGSGIRWPELDEDISVDGTLHGIPARRPRK
jgi:regulator of protease activity HflC (stomatin/prohibitin superfamily)